MDPLIPISSRWGIKLILFAFKNELEGEVPWAALDLLRELTSDPAFTTLVISLLDSRIHVFLFYNRAYFDIALLVGMVTR